MGYSRMADNTPLFGGLFTNKNTNKITKTLFSLKTKTNEYEYENLAFARGSFSEIYKGKRLIDNKEVAIKKITKIVHKKYLEKEIEIMEESNHPNILRLLEAVEEEGIQYMILEYCDGGTLSEYISKGGHEMDYIFCIEIILGIEYLYSKGIMHRDIKPQNILICEGHIRITDFGFSREVEEDDVLSTFCGSPLYMSPEIFTEGSYNEKSDIWSLGVILYEVITKKHPYHSKTRVELVNKLRNKTKIEFEKIADIGLRDLVKKMLIFEVKERIGWEEIFGHDWVRNNKRILGLESRELNTVSIKEIEDISYGDLSEIKLGSPATTDKEDKMRMLSATVSTGVLGARIDEKISKSAPASIGESILEDYVGKVINRKGDDIMRIGKVAATAPPTPNIFKILKKQIGGPFNRW